MAKKVLFSTDARDKIKKGMDILARAVRVTIGPFGRNVALAKSYGGPTITNDGVSIAKEITLEDQFENMGVEILKEVASKTNDIAGDGTSTSIVLAHALIDKGMDHLGKGINAIALRAGIERATKEVEHGLDLAKRDVQTDEEIQQVATISAENKDIGKIIADTVKKVGKDGVVTVEESQTFGITSDIAEGMEFDKGFISPYMMTNPERLEAEYKNVPVIITDKKISAIKEILPLLEKLAQTGKKDVVIIADDVDGEALATLVLNKLRGTFNVLAIKAPGYGERKKELLEDIAVTLGGKVIASDLNMSFDKVEIAMLGVASKVVATKDKTVVVGKDTNKKEIEARVVMLKNHAEESTSKYEKEKIYERIAKLTGGVAVVYVGAATELEMKYLKLKIEDAVNATKAAIAEGIVAGGGVTLAKIAHKLKDRLPAKDTNDEMTGERLVYDALFEPLYQIVENVYGEKKQAQAIVKKVLAHTSTDAGFNALTKEEVKDMFVAGIIDPVKVTRSALKNATSIASTFLTTEAAVVDIPEPKTQTSDGRGGGMDMY
ncbi:MAG: chaperonin GroEL [Alphaproteobacteria bacterium]|nr:chaperonin GroEL [Alphaproteobacteria bacterium]